MSKAAGIVLIVLGIVALAYGGITYTTRDEVVDIGPLEVTKENQETVPLPPLLGAVSLIGGVALLVSRRR